VTGMTDFGFTNSITYMCARQCCNLYIKNCLWNVWIKNMKHLQLTDAVR